MATLSSMPVLNAYTNEDWNWEAFQFLAAGVPEDFAGASAKMGLRLASTTTNAIEFNSDAGTLTITQPNQIGVTAPLAAIENLVPGLYNWDLVVTYGSGDIQTVLSGQVLVIQGIS